MAEEPVFRLHVISELFVCIIDVGNYDNIQICQCDLICCRSCDWKCSDCPVNFHGIARFVMDPHCGHEIPCPSSIDVTKL